MRNVFMKKEMVQIENQSSSLLNKNSEFTIDATHELFIDYFKWIQDRSISFNLL